MEIVNYYALYFEKILFGTLYVHNWKVCHWTNNHQFDRLKEAMKINVAIAIQSTSFGIFQLMGEYYSYSSASSEETFFNNMESSEIFQINATVDFLLKDGGKKGFAQALNSKNWELVASIYNGQNWKDKNPNYATNLEKYYRKKPWIK